MADFTNHSDEFLSGHVFLMTAMAIVAVDMKMKSARYVYRATVMHLRSSFQVPREAAEEIVDRVWDDMSPPDGYEAPDVTVAMIRLREIGTEQQLQHAYMGYARIARLGGKEEEEGISMFLETVRSLWGLPDYFDTIRDHESSLILETRRFLHPSPPDANEQVRPRGCGWVLVGPLLFLVLSGCSLLAA